MRSLGAAAAVLIGAIAVGVLLWQRTVSTPPPRELLAGGNEPPAGRDAAWDDRRIPNLIIRAARDYLPPAEPGADVSALIPAHKP